MQQQNDMDDLFRKSAEVYPLNTYNSNWNAVEQRLKNDDDAEPEILSKRRYAIFFSILVVLITSLAGYVYFSDQDHSNLVVSAPVKINHRKAELKKPFLNKEPDIFNNSPVQQSGNTNQAVFKESVVALHPAHVVLSNHNNTSVETDQNKSSVAFNKPGNSYQADVTSTGVSVFIANELKKQQANFLLKHSNSIAVNQTAITDKKQLQPVIFKKRSVFYTGLFLTREISYVHAYQTSQGNVGYGFILGFNLNKHLSVETGLSKQKKNFNTAGDYFSKDNLQLRATTKLTEVKGRLKTTVIPVNVRYNFPRGKLGQFFVSTGLSTLVLHRQFYDYEVEKTEGSESLERSYPAERDIKLFSQFNVSAGYEKNICNIIKLRVEPYYQLPLNKIGLGKVDLSSAGVNVGIVKNF